MYRTILVPLDQSERAETIIPHVTDLARQYKSNVILMHVVDVEPSFYVPRPYGVGFEDVPQVDVEQLIDSANVYLDKLCHEFNLQGISAATRVEYGPVVAAIIETAEREEVDLIAMASHGRSGLSRVFYGSVAAGVLQRVDRPLLLVRAQ